MKFPLWPAFFLLVPLHAQESTLPLIKNGNLNSSIFLAGWKSKGEITKAPDLANEEGKSASIGAGGILFQDFIQPPSVGLTNFKISFLIRVNAFDGNARIRLRSNENDVDIITIRPTPQGVDAYGFNTINGWKSILTKPLSAGKVYRIAISAKDLNQPSRTYTLSLTDEGSATVTSSAIRTFHYSPHPAAEAIAETITFDTSTDNGLTVDEIQLSER